VPVKRVQSFEFYGADAQPKPARKGVERGGVARTHGRGVSAGGGVYLGHTIRSRVSPAAPMSPVV
jgi:hypothetical protein